MLKYLEEIGKIEIDGANEMSRKDQNDGEPDSSVIHVYVSILLRNYGVTSEKIEHIFHKVYQIEFNYGNNLKRYNILSFTGRTVSCIS